MTRAAFHRSPLWTCDAGPAGLTARRRRAAPSAGLPAPPGDAPASLPARELGGASRLLRGLRHPHCHLCAGDLVSRLQRWHCMSNGLLSYWGFTGRMAFPGWQQQIAPDSVACEEQGFVLSQSSDQKSEVKVSPGCSPSEGSGEGPSCFFPLPVAVAVGSSLRPPPPAPPL